MSANSPSIAGVENAVSVRQTLAFVTFGVVYYLLAAYAVSLPFPARLPVLIWPGHGVALGVLLVAPVRRWPAYLALVALATLAVGFDLHAPWQRIAASIAVNVAQPLFAAALLQRLTGTVVQIDTIRGLGSLFIGLVLPVGAMSALDAGFTYLHTAAPFKDQWSVVFVSTLLGMLLTAPLILAWSRRGIAEAVEFTRVRLPELLALYLFLILTT
jgi:integral membrane sensor domain MASE1